MYKLFIVEDDLNLRTEIVSLLKRYDYEVYHTDDFRNVVKEIIDIKPHLVLIDVNLPYLDGFHICRNLQRKQHMPVIIISARDSVMDQVFGIETGADDYITKPFKNELLIAKIKSLIRRAYNVTESAVNTIPNFYLNSDNLTLEYKGRVIELTKNEFNLLSILTSNPGKVIKREELISTLWDDGIFVDDNTLTVNITRVKGKLKMLGLENNIKTKRGLGYYFINNNAGE